MNSTKNKIEILTTEYRQGFIFGFHSPSISITLAYTLNNKQLLNTLTRDLKSCFLISEPELQHASSEKQHELEFLITWQNLFTEHANLGCFDEAKVSFNEHESRAIVHLPCPVIDPQQSFQLFNKLVNFINTNTLLEFEELNRFVSNIISSLKSSNRDTNSVHFLRSAYNQSIPVINRDGNKTLQYGFGKHAKLFNSSFTENTSAIASNLARDKSVCNQVLTDCGLPVPKQFKINSVQQALNLAQQLTYPVVIKPATMEGGIGVYANLTHPEQVKSAFNNVVKITKDVLIEKHIFGKDYRIVVFQNEVIWAIERAPAHVIGDGTSNIKELIEQMNQQPERNLAWMSMVKIQVNDDLTAILKQQNCNLETVLKKNQRINLSNKANISAGGTPIPVMDQIHPDNIALAIRATQALRLDLAGVDLLIEDISQSWQESECGICEMNAQPQLGIITSAHLYPLILHRLTENQGRIPIHIIIGNSDFSKSLCVELTHHYKQKNLAYGLFIEGKVQLEHELLNSGCNAFQAGKILSSDTRVDAIVMQVNDMSMKRLGMPFNYIDSLIVCELDALHRLDGIEVDKQGKKELLDLMQPASSKLIFCDEYTDNSFSEWHVLEKNEQKILSIINAK